ncbi:MAG: DNA-3-methyladenine glycosylase I [Alphaproteobacteria bacterium]|nr:DNA-3-methyladenine glycosylase I [Rhodospirillales bacterium]MCW9046160.1 DNA-3-methyladenine glycosylase I [Alphaproteobacteria bacterium]
MIDFSDIWQKAAERKGGDQALEALMPDVKPPEQLKAIQDDRWLATMTKRVFQAGFVWKIIEAKWDGFEEAFHSFDPSRLSFLPPDELDQLASDTRIIRNGQKIKATIENAVFVADLAQEHGSAAAFFADWPTENFIGLLDILKKRGSRLGGLTGQVFLRTMGKDSFILNPDVIAALIQAGVVEKKPTSKRDLTSVQEAFNTWRSATGKPLSHISKTLACSLDAS